MAGAGKKTFQVNEVLSAADVNQYLMDQSVMRFADSSARSSAIGTPSEGMVSYLDDTDQVEVFDGSQWVNFTGDITQVTAGTALTGGGTEGNVTLNVDETELFTGGTAGYTALSNGTAGLSYQPVSHNYIINGAFDIWQRGTSFTSDGFTADRFKTTLGGSTTTTTRQSFTPADLNVVGFGDAKYFHRFSITAANGASRVSIEQSIEDVQTLAGQNITISFWAKADTTRSLGNLLVVQSFGSGGSSNVDISPDISGVSMTTSWQRFTVNASVPSISGKTVGTGSKLFLRFDFTPVDGAVYDFWGLQVEAGSIATPFKRHAPSLQGELAACHRYYQVIADGDDVALATVAYYQSDWVFGSLRFSTEMRTTPTLEVETGTDYYKILHNNTVDNLTTISQGAMTKYGFRIQTNDGDASGTQGDSGFLYSDNASSFVAVSAEL